MPSTADDMMKHTKDFCIARRSNRRTWKYLSQLGRLTEMKLPEWSDPAIEDLSQTYRDLLGRLFRRWEDTTKLSSSMKRPSVWTATHRTRVKMLGKDISKLQRCSQAFPTLHRRSKPMIWLTPSHPKRCQLLYLQL